MMDNSDSTKKLYEVGYLLVPIIPEDKVLDEVNTIRGYIENNGGFIVSEEQPKMIKLSYEIKQKFIAGKGLSFDSAYFGSIRYQLTPSAILEMKEALEKNDKILRFIIIKPVKDSPRVVRVVSQKVKVDGKKEKKTLLSEQELDKEIDQLLENNKVSA